MCSDIHDDYEEEIVKVFHRTVPEKDPYGNVCVQITKLCSPDKLARQMQLAASDPTMLQKTREAGTFHTFCCCVHCTRVVLFYVFNERGWYFPYFFAYITLHCILFCVHYITLHIFCIQNFPYFFVCLYTLHYTVLHTCCVVLCFTCMHAYACACVYVRGCTPCVVLHAYIYTFTYLLTYLCVGTCVCVCVTCTRTCEMHADKECTD